MNPNVTGRVAVVTGASRGLGAGLAVHFAASGMHLGLCARHRPRLAVRTRPTAQAGHVVSAETPVLSAVDVTDRDAWRRFADAVVERFGRIDLWVNNAGLLGPIAPLALAGGAALAETIAVNVTGVANGSSVFAAHVRERPGRGVLVNVSSGAATKPYEGWAAYCASKAAVDQLTRVVALEEARHGLAAYAVSPGLVDTEMQAAIRRRRRGVVPRAGALPAGGRGTPVQLTGVGGRAHLGAGVRERAAGLGDVAHPGPGDGDVGVGVGVGREAARVGVWPRRLGSAHAEERWPQGREAGGRSRRHVGNDGQYLVVRPQAPAQGQGERRQRSAGDQPLSAGSPSTSAGRHSPILP